MHDDSTLSPSSVKDEGVLIARRKEEARRLAARRVALEERIKKAQQEHERLSAESDALTLQRIMDSIRRQRVA